MNKSNNTDIDQFPAANASITTGPLRMIASPSILLGLCLATVAFAVAPQPSASYSFGKTLAQWQETWFRWSVGALSVPTDSNGNAVINNVVLMSLPDVPVDGTRGSLDLTLKPGQPFVLPLFLLFGNSYRDGSPDDQLASIDDFRNLDLELTLDGVTILEGANATQYFSQTTFVPPIPITDPASTFSAYLWLQGVTIVHAPLLVGQHTITLDEKIFIPEYDLTLEFHNTWNVTVKAGK